MFLIIIDMQNNILEKHGKINYSLPKVSVPSQKQTVLFYLLFSCLQTPPPIHSNYQLSCQAAPIHCHIAANKCSITATARVFLRIFLPSLCLRYPGCLAKQEEYIHTSLTIGFLYSQEIYLLNLPE